MMMHKRLLPLLLPLALGACGFQPVYSPALSANSSPLQIEEIPGRAGHELREALILETRNGLPGMQGKAGHMAVLLEERVLQTGFRCDGSAFRAVLRLNAQYVVDIEGKSVTGEQSAETNYDVPDAPFADVASQNDATERTARELARRITDDLIIKLGQDG